MKTFDSIYIGLVINDNDPEKRGRVQVYVPYISSVVEQHLNPDLINVERYITNVEDFDWGILDNLRAILPWAEYAAPIFGGNSKGRYNETEGKTSISDTNTWTLPITPTTTSNTNINTVSRVQGERPAVNTSTDKTQTDYWTASNPHTKGYDSTPYSNKATGLFSIPNIGAHVYVFFINGDPNFPIYFAAHYSQEDYKEIYSAIDHPNIFGTQKPQSPVGTEHKTYRRKHLFNSTKHSLIFDDTDLKETLKIVHYSGSFKEFTNFANIEFARNNDQKLIMGDEFKTVRRASNNYVASHRREITGGDKYVTIGETDEQIVKDWLKIQKEIHDYKMLFDIQRAEFGEANNPNDLSSMQKRIGYTGILNGIKYQNGFVQCPVCGGTPYNPYDPAYTALDPTYTEAQMWLMAPAFLSICGFGQQQTIDNPTLDSMSGLVPSASAVTAAEAASIFGPACQQYLKLDQITVNADGSIIPNIEPTPEDIQKNAEHPGSACLPPTSMIPHPLSLQPGIWKGATCFLCGGKLFSPSTENGIFNIEPSKIPVVGDMDLKIMSESVNLMKLEEQFGKGGDEIKRTSGNKVEQIGLVMNDLKSFRIDPIGKLKIDRVVVAPQGSYSNFTPSPHVEYVDVADILGGDYILNVSNKYKLLVGARGINIKTFGPIDMYGTIINFVADQLNISSKNEILIDGGERLSFRAKKIAFMPVEHNAVVIDGQLNVMRNAIIQGGTMLEGEVGLLHVTAPLEWQKTEYGVWTGVPCVPVAAILDGILPTEIKLPDHYHPFKNLPLSLMPHREGVRQIMIDKGINNLATIVAASPTQLADVECSDKTWSSVGSEFTKAAWSKSKSEATAQGIDVNTAWAQWDTGYSSGHPTGGGPMTYVSRSCANAPQTDPSIKPNIIITANYYWSWGKTFGNLQVIGTVSSDGTIVEAPK